MILERFFTHDVLKIYKTLYLKLFKTTTMKLTQGSFSCRNYRILKFESK